ncbi:MAG: hypothetical protein RL226_1664 [Bacteroidota bacterium]
MTRIAILFALTLLWACSGDSSKTEASSLPDSGEQKERIDELEVIVENDTLRNDLVSRQRLLNAYTDYSNKFREDELSPEYLFRAAKLAIEMGKSRNAIDYLTNLHDGFPEYKKRTEAAFLVGFIYETMLNDRIMAQKAYEKVVELYPDTQWAEDAKASINLLYMTDEQKIQFFMEKNQQPS